MIDSVIVISPLNSINVRTDVDKFVLLNRVGLTKCRSTSCF